MKKTSLILMAAAVLALASCDDKVEGVIPTNPQLPVMGADGFEMQAKMPAELDLTALNNAGTAVPVAEILVNQMPEGYELKLVGEIGRDAEFARIGQVDLTISEDGRTVTATPDAIEAGYVVAMGKSAKPKQVYFRIEAYAVDQNNPNVSVRLGAEDAYYAKAEPTIAPYDLNIVIEREYFCVGTIDDWSLAKAVPFQHSGLDPYDDPIFVLPVDITVDAARNGWWWKIVPADVRDAGEWLTMPNGQFGPEENGSTALEGLLMAMSVTGEGDAAEVHEPGAGCVKEPGMYKFILDMENQEYRFDTWFHVMYVNTASGSWSRAPRLTSTDGNTYFGVVNLSGAFKVALGPDWDEYTSYGMGAEADMIAEGGDFFAVEEPGVYAVKVNVKDQKISYAKLESVGLIGVFNSWGEQAPLTPSMDRLTWRGRVKLDGGVWKIRMNDDWDFNLGGDVNELVCDGADIAGFEAGEYNVTLHLNTLPYTITMVKR